MNKTIDTETLLLKVESHEHRIGIMENLLRDAKQVLTLEEAALFMGISKSSLYKMTHKHELPFFHKLAIVERSDQIAAQRVKRAIVHGAAAIRIGRDRALIGLIVPADSTRAGGEPPPSGRQFSNSVIWRILAVVTAGPEKDLDVLV